MTGRDPAWLTTKTLLAELQRYYRLKNMTIPQYKRSSAVRQELEKRMSKDEIRAALDMTPQCGENEDEPRNTLPKVRPLHRFQAVNVRDVRPVPILQGGHMDTAKKAQSKRQAGDKDKEVRP